MSQASLLNSKKTTMIIIIIQHLVRFRTPISFVSKTIAIKGDNVNGNPKSGKLLKTVVHYILISSFLSRR